MARYRVLEKSFMDGKIVDVGAIVHFVGQAASNLQLLEGEVEEPAPPAAQVFAASPQPGIRIRADGQYFTVYCAGCKHAHSVPINGGDPAHRWTWDGRTLSPSVRHYHNALDENDEPKGPEVTECHYNVTNGRIFYHGDCTVHSLRGEYDIPPFPEKYGLP
jgi:hypothetical protein